MSFLRTVELKRDGKELSPEEITAFVASYTQGDLPDYQVSAFLMAIFLMGMSREETVALTQAMLQSGQTMQWADAHRPVVDKHSTGGVGDKTSLVIAPLLAEIGLSVPMISGRGLGATGGTLDKLEAIPGFETKLPLADLQAQVTSQGCVICGASPEIAPADRKLYALRDVTATVASIPLITASILSKKLSEGLDALILDVKFGSGAFMQTVDDARALARSLVDVSSSMGVQTRALLTNMDQPLGDTAGNALEVNEVAEVFNGQGPTDVRDLSVRLSAEIATMTGAAATLEDATHLFQSMLNDGRAKKRFEEMVDAQGGHYAPPLPTATKNPITAQQDGFIHRIDTHSLGQTVVDLGGGRSKLDDIIDPAVGLSFPKKVGDAVTSDEPLVFVYADLDREELSKLESSLRAAFSIESSQPQPCPLILETINSHDV